MNRPPLLRTFPPPRRFALYSSVSAAVGVLVLLLMEVGRPGWFAPGLLVVGAFLGFSLNLGASVAEGIFFAAFRVHRSWPLAGRAALASVLHFAGGIGGFLVTATVASAIHPGLEGFENVSSAPVFGLLTAAVGGTFHVVRALRRRLGEKILEVEAERSAQKELQTARKVQERLLPPQVLRGRSFEVHARNLPAGAVAGDLYDIFRLDDGVVGIAVGDVAGKGMPASLHMVSVKAMLPLLALERSAAETLCELNRRLRDELGPREFVALAFARYQPATGELELANAGLPDPYLLRGDVVPVEGLGARLPLGVRDDVAYENRHLQLEPGEALLMISDGMPEAIRRTGNPLGYAGFERVLRTTTQSQNDRGEWLDRVVDGVRRRTEAAQQDDWTALLLERRLTGPRHAQAAS